MSQDTNEIETLAEMYPKAQERMQEVLEAYQSVGAAGWFAVPQIKAWIKQAREAAASQDTVAMVRLYRESQLWKL
jgi:hypothetical protein